MRTVVDAEAWRLRPNFGELMKYKDLFRTLAYRDLRVRYAQTFLGVAWALIQPLATLIIMTVIFGRAVKVETNGIPYPLFAIVGIAGWTFFSFVMKEAGGSIVGAQEMVRKIYFPRLIIPLSKAVVGTVDLVIALLFMCGLMIWYGFLPSRSLVWLPFAVLALISASLAVGIWVSALTLRYRDLIHVVPFTIQFGLFATPVAYPASLITDNLPGWAEVAYYLNPMTGICEVFRWCVLGVPTDLALCGLSFAVAFVLLIAGILYFKSVERFFADIV